jgi:pyroglutamyl-peptidase
MNVLITGFEPFGNEKTNASSLLLPFVSDRIAEASIVKLVLPTVYGDSVDKLRDALRRHRPGIVLCLGQDFNATAISVERVAINLDDSGTADNKGVVRIDEPIVPEGPAAYFASLPVKRIVDALRGLGFPASLSKSAGTYVCNHVMYGLLHLLEEERIPAAGGFMHVPGIHTIPAERLAQAVTEAVRISVERLARDGANVENP